MKAKENKWHPNLLLLLILILGGAIRLLFLFTPNMDSDQAINGLMARHILKGALPILYYGQDYCGSIETYFISTIFFLFGVSRFTLNLTIVLESLFFVLFIYYLAKLIFNQGTALLSALFSALASYYLIFHSVLARSAYLEMPIIGVLLFIFSHQIIYGNKQRSEYFLGFGFFCGLGIWTHFLVIFYLLPCFLFIFIKDRWFWRRQTVLFFLLGLMFGGLPLWVHNTLHPLITWHYLLGTSGGGEPFLPSLKDFFLNRFPEILGMKNNDTARYSIPYFSFLLYIISLGSFLFLLLSRIKNFMNLVRLKISQSSGLDLLLFFLLLFPVIYSLSGFDANHTSRYLQPLFSALPILFAVFIQRLYSLSAVSAVLFLVLILFSNLYGTMIRVPLLDKIQAQQFNEARKSESELFQFLKERNIRKVYCHEYWTSARLTFDAREEILFAQPIYDRYPAYSDWIDRDPHPAFLFPGDNKDFENTLNNIGGSFQKNQVSGYSLYYDFSPPSYRYLELDPENWKVSANTHPSEAANIFDRDIRTRWSSLTPQKAGLSLQIDLKKIVPDLGRITLLSGNPEDIPRGLRIEISNNGLEWRTIHEVQGIWGDLFWSGPHPFYRPGIGRIDFTFTPQPGRFFRLTQLGNDPTFYWSVAECFIYQASPKTESSSKDLRPLISYLKRFDPVSLHASPWLQSQFPLDWRVKQRALERQPGEADLVQTLSNPVIVVEKENASTLIHCLKKNLRGNFRETEVDGRLVFDIPTSTEKYQSLSSKKWHFQTNLNPQKASLAADGKIATRWTTDRPQIPGAYFQIDLGRMEKIARIRLLTGNSVNDYPRGCSIRYSIDGQTWDSLDSIMSPVLLRWTGETVLKTSENPDFVFPTTPMRYIQIINTGKDDVYYWSIHEVELYKRQDTE